MYGKSLAFAAMAALAMASTAQAQPVTSVQAFLDEMESQADARLTEAGVTISGPARLRFAVDSEGHVWGVRIVRSSGSAATDAQMQQALYKLQMPRLPSNLVGASVSMVVGPDALARASAP